MRSAEPAWRASQSLQPLALSLALKLKFLDIVSSVLHEVFKIQFPHLYAGTVALIIQVFQNGGSLQPSFQEEMQCSSSRGGES